MTSLDYTFYSGITCSCDSASERAIGLARLIGPIEVGAAMDVQCISAVLFSETGKSHLLEWSLAFCVRDGDSFRWDGAGLGQTDQNAEGKLFFNKDYDI